MSSSGELTALNRYNLPMSERSKLIKESKRVVIKLGTAILMQDEGGIALSRFYSFVEDIADLFKSGREVLIVSSGAVGLGVKELSLDKRPADLPTTQACAAVGQGILQSMYADAFRRLGVKTAQVLLCEEDFTNRKKYLNLRSTIARLLELGVIPIINENDTVSTSEIESSASASGRKVNFGDNDKLSALVASKVDADMLLILTDVNGLYSDDPNTCPDAELIDTVADLTPYLIPKAEKKVNGKKGAHQGGRGGIRSKLEAAAVVTQSGLPCVIAGGRNHKVIERLFNGESLGTIFLPGAAMAGKSRWIAFATSINGSVTVNNGARDALVKKKASLLPAGIVKVDGSFARGDVIGILSEDGDEFARGLANYNCEETRLISGKHSDSIDQLIQHRNYDAVVTRDNIAFTRSQQTDDH